MKEILIKFISRRAQGRFPIILLSYVDEITKKSSYMY